MGREPCQIRWTTRRNAFNRLIELLTGWIGRKSVPIPHGLTAKPLIIFMSAHSLDPGLCPKCQKTLSATGEGGAYCAQCEQASPPPPQEGATPNLAALLEKAREELLGTSSKDAGGTDAGSGAATATSNTPSDDELQRLAAMVGGTGYDAALFRNSGRLAFHCPVCNCWLELPAKQAAALVSCTNCQMEITAPDPASGVPAQAMRELDKIASSLPKAVLPPSRTVQDKRLAEGQSGGRMRRSAPLPVVDRNLGERMETAETGPLPILPKQDIAMSGSVLPSKRRNVGRGLFKRGNGGEANAPDTTTSDSGGSISGETGIESESTAEDRDPKGVVRFNDKQRDYRPIKKIESEVEETQNWGANATKAPIGRKMVIFAWATLILGGLGTAVWAMKEVFRDKSADEAQGTADSLAIEDATLNARIGKTVINNYFETEKPEARLAFVRHPEITGPRMKDFYGLASLPPCRIESMDALSEAKLDGIEWFFANVTTTDGAAHMLAMEVQGDANNRKLLIDWESAVAWAPMKWEEFLIKQPEEPVEFRVFIQLSDFWEPPFDDKNRWVSFKVHRPDVFGKAYGYCFGYVDTENGALWKVISNAHRTSMEKGENGRLRCRVGMKFLPEGKRSSTAASRVEIVSFQTDWLEITPNAAPAATEQPTPAVPATAGPANAPAPVSAPQ